MALDRCPSHHDTNQGHHLREAFKFLRLPACESKISCPDESTLDIRRSRVVGVMGQIFFGLGSVMSAIPLRLPYTVKWRQEVRLFFW
jgi:hypothetical protein